MCTRVAVVKIFSQGPQHSSPLPVQHYYIAVQGNILYFWKYKKKYKKNKSLDCSMHASQPIGLFFQPYLYWRCIMTTHKVSRCNHHEDWEGQVPPIFETIEPATYWYPPSFGTHWYPDFWKIHRFSTDYRNLIFSWVTYTPEIHATTMGCCSPTNIFSHCSRYKFRNFLPQPSPLQGGTALYTLSFVPSNLQPRLRPQVTCDAFSGRNS